MALSPLSPSVSLSNSAAVSLYIPIGDSSEAVEISLDAHSMPAEHQDITDLLTLELAHPDLWLQFALYYYRNGAIDQFVQMLRTVTGKEGLEAYKDDKFRSGKVALINALAAHWTQVGLENHDTSMLDIAFAAFNTSASMDMHQPMTKVCQGYLQMMRANEYQGYSAADTLFDTAIAEDKQKELVLSVMGKACTSFALGNYQTALTYLQRTMKMNPAMPAYTRAAVGLVYLAMQEPHMARRAFNRTLQIDEDNVVALIGLSSITDQSSTLNLQIRADLAIRAFRVDPSDPLVLCQLSRIFFEKKDVVKSKELAMKALQLASANDMKAEARYLIGRACHCLCECDEAYTHYQQALSLNPNHALSSLGFAQMCIRRNALTDAAKALDNVVKIFPNNFDVLRIAGAVHSALNHDRRAFQLLQSAVDQVPNDPELLLEFCQAAQRIDAAKALDLYTQVIQFFHQNTTAIVPHTIYHNIAVLQHKLGHFNDAERYYRLALGISENDSILNTAEITSHTLTTVYNFALLLEQRKQLDDAQKLHENILLKFGDYVDSRLRLGLISQQQGQEEAAQKHFDTASQLAPNSRATKVLLGKLAVQRHDLEAAIANFKAIAGDNKVDDEYAKVELANIHVTMAKNRTRKLQTHAQKFNKPINIQSDEKVRGCYEKAAKYYRMVLKEEKHNAFAALGLGVLLVQEGFLNEAKDVFTLIKECMPSMREAWVNLAHVYAALEKPALAISLYEQALQRFYQDEPNVDLMLCLARSQYMFGALEDCQATLNQAHAKFPDDPLVLYNLSLAQEEYGIKMLQKPKEQRSLAQVHAAIDCLNAAHKSFESLQTPTNSLRFKLFPIAEKSKSHFKFCEQSIELSQKHLTYAIQRDAELKAKELAAKQASEEYERLKQAEIAEKQRLALEESERIEREAEAKRKYLEQIQEEWMAVSASKGGASADEAKDNNEELVSERSLKKKKRKKDKTVVSESGSAAEDVVKKTKHKKRRKKHIQEDEDRSTDGASMEVPDNESGELAENASNSAI